MNYREIYDKGKGALAAAGVPEAELDARLLLEYVCGTDRNTLLVHADREVTAEEEAKYLSLIDRRGARIPLQHLTGTQNFMGLDFKVTEAVLVPRQDTEILVEEALGGLHDGMRVLDMCTGSGCILISLLHYKNDCVGLGVDVSPEALAVAKENAEKLLTPEKEVSFLQSNLFEKVEGKFDLIVSNPPYIATAEIEKLMPEVKDHEPRIALDGTEDGLFFYRKITEGCKEHLVKGGELYYEIGYDQGEAVKELMENAGFLEVKIIKDYAGCDRVVCGTLGFGAF